MKGKCQMRSLYFGASVAAERLINIKHVTDNNFTLWLYRCDNNHVPVSTTVLFVCSWNWCVFDYELKKTWNHIIKHVAMLQHWIFCESWMIITDMLYEYNLHFAWWLIPSFLSVSLYHTHISPFWFCVFLYCAAFDLCSLCSGVWHLCAICLHFALSLSSFPSSSPSICVFPLALAPIFIQIHRAVSVWRLSDLSKACSSTSPSHSAPNPLASHCRPSKTGEHPEK